MQHTSVVVINVAACRWLWILVQMQMIKDVIVLGSLALFGTLAFSLIIGFSVILLPLPFMALIIPLCLAGQLVFALKLEEIAEKAGYKFKE